MSLQQLSPQSAKLSQVAGLVPLCLMVSLATGLVEANTAVIEILDPSGNTRQTYAFDQLHDALDDVLSNETIVLAPGIDYPLQQYTLSDKSGVSIVGGEQSAITVTPNSVLEYSASFDETKFGAGQRIWFSGDVPRGLLAGKSYCVLSHWPDDNYFTVADSPSGPKIEIGDPPHNNPFFVHWTANIQCGQSGSSAIPYAHILQLLGCDNCTLRNVRFDGRGLQNESQQGIALYLYGCDGTITLDGICSSQTRGKTLNHGAIDRIHHEAYGLLVASCDDVTIRKCAGYENGNVTLALSGISGRVQVEDVAIANSVMRDMALFGGEDNDTSYDASTKMIFTRCYLYNNDNKMSTTYYPGADPGDLLDVPRMSVNINFSGATQYPEVKFTELYIDWRNLNSDGTTFNTDYGQTSPLMKAQNTKMLKFSRSELLHDGNAVESQPPSMSFKVDPTGGIGSLAFQRCTLSGGIELSNQPNDRIESFRFTGGRIQRDGHFDLSAPFWGMEYPKVELKGFPSDNKVLIDNVVWRVVLMNYRGFGDVIAGGGHWRFRDLDVSLSSVPLVTDRYFFEEANGVQDSPTRNDAAVSWNGASILVESPPASGTAFRFSNDDPLPTIENP